MKSVSLPVRTVTACALLGVVGFMVWHTPLSRLLGTDVFKSTYQFLLLTVLGGVVGLFFREVARERELLEQRRIRGAEARAEIRETKREVWAELSGLYNDTLDAIVLFNAKGFQRRPWPSEEDGVVLAEPYEDFALKLMKSRARLEGLVHQLESRGDAYADPDSILANLHRMSDYLYCVIVEYSSAGSEFSDDPPTAPAAKLPSLIEMLGFRFVPEPGRMGAWHSEFQGPHYELVSLLHTEVLDGSRNGSSATGGAAQPN